MRICVAGHAVMPRHIAPQWRRWRGGDNDVEWLVWRTQDAAAPAIQGALEVGREQLLAVSAREIAAARIGHLRHIAETLTTSQLADWVRGQRGDPSHDWYAWVAPLELTARTAGEVYVRALELPKTTHSCIVLRPCHSAPGWFAWLALGSLMEPVPAPLDRGALNPEQIADLDRGMQSRFGRKVLEGRFHRFASRELARATALALIRARRAALVSQQREILAGWADEAHARLVRNNGRLVDTFGNCQMVPIAIREGPATGGGESWNLPIVETIAE